MKYNDFDDKPIHFQHFSVLSAIVCFYTFFIQIKK